MKKTPSQYKKRPQDLIKDLPKNATNKNTSPHTQNSLKAECSEHVFINDASAYALIRLIRQKNPSFVILLQ